MRGHIEYSLILLAPQNRVDMRRFLPSMLLFLLVLCAQQAALVHEIGHGLGAAAADPVAAAAHADARDPGNAGGAAYCEKCFQFAHVTGALAAFAPGLAPDLTLGQSASSPSPALLAADAPLSRSRGPPSNL